MNTDSYLTKNIKAILAVIVVVLGISYFYMCSIRDIKPDPQILIAMVGAIGTVLGYFFGSSSSSAKKDDVLADNMSKPSVPVSGDRPTINVNNSDTDKKE